eukprot:TRINITY_DN2187_c0_g1_i1.p1 TRINITY_DN2187_c0_g1~~TRINITY_DN2187_c0_g1_i1.p1  ORF type:complete len:283 (-),score=73.69 TRINITY_DN2187_c0_g1_i1:277-1125(-)
MREKVEGEVLDFSHSGTFLTGRVTQAGENYEGTEGSDICIITAGVRQRAGESRLSLLERNVKVMKSIIPPLVAKSPDTLILMVSNPCDIMTYVAWKLSGLPKERVFGSGTYLDSSRFRVLIGESLNVSPFSVHGWIVGEHGDSSVPVWSSVSVAGIPLDSLKEGEGEHFADSCKGLHKKVVDAAYKVIELKGYTNWAIGAAVGKIVELIFKDSRRIIPLSTCCKGLYGIESDVFLSVPVVISRAGVARSFKQPLKEEEEAALKKSASTLEELLLSESVVSSL